MLLKQVTSNLHQLERNHGAWIFKIFEARTFYSLSKWFSYRKLIKLTILLLKHCYTAKFLSWLTETDGIWFPVISAVTFGSLWISDWAPGVSHLWLFMPPSPIPCKALLLLTVWQTCLNGWILYAVNGRSINGLKYENKSLYSRMPPNDVFACMRHWAIVVIAGFVLSSSFRWAYGTTFNIVYHVTYLHSVISQWKINFPKKKINLVNVHRVTSVAGRKTFRSSVFRVNSIFCCGCQTFAEVTWCGTQTFFPYTGELFRFISFFRERTFHKCFLCFCSRTPSPFAVCRLEL